MTRNYNVSGERRKELVKKVAEFTGEKEKYLGIPTYSYQTGPFNIGKNGELSWEPEAEEKATKLVFWLKIAGFTAEDEEQAEAGQDNETAGMEQAEEAADIQPEETTAEAPAESVADPADASVEPDVKGVPDNGTDAETAVSDSIPAENGEGAGTEDGADDPVEGLHADAPAEPDTLSVSIPDDLTDSQRENLIKAVRSKETLLKHAFKTDSVEIHMEDGKLIFPWFTASDGDHTDAYILFLTKLIKFAKEAKRVTGADHPVANEKYAMRTWLLRLDMIGPEYKGCRKVLLENLTGSSAFRDGHKKSGGEKNEEAAV